MDIKLEPVKSNHFNAIGYDSKSKTLAIKFNNNVVYYYSDYPLHLFNELNQAESKGKYFSSNINGKFKHIKT